jgi:type IV pilus assembly protein PilE
MTTRLSGMAYGLSQARQGNAHRSRGFTFLELVVAMAICALLAAIALPAYSNQVRTARRVDATATLLTLAALQEQFYGANGMYTNNVTVLGMAANPGTTPKEYYQIAAVVDVNRQTFTLTATRQGVQTGDTVCGDLTLTHTGVKSAVKNTETNPARNCW